MQNLAKETISLFKRAIQSFQFHDAMEKTIVSLIRKSVMSCASTEDYIVVMTQFGGILTFYYDNYLYLSASNY